MTHFDVFNGDADGLCSLHQLRLAEPRDSVLVTGVKRDIDLVRRIDIRQASSATILDVSLDKNRDALVPLLENGVQVAYFDHHYPGEIPAYSVLQANIDTDANTCTGLIVNQHLQGAHLAWAVTAAFGDNLLNVAREAAAPLHLTTGRMNELQSLGTLLNYNGYGSSLEDLFFPPAELYLRMKPFADPFAFMAEDDAFAVLEKGYTSDMQRAADLQPEQADDNTALFMFPDEPFARRVSGVLSNDLAQRFPDRAHALLSLLPGGGYLVSVRAPLNRKDGADALCRQFDSGGGRKAAAGINRLPESAVERFAAAFSAQFGPSV